MSLRKKTSSSALTSASSSSSRPVLGVSKLTLAARQRAVQNRNTDIDEMARIMSQLFTDPVQAEAMSSLKNVDGTPFFNLKNKAVLMDVRAMIREEGFEASMQRLQTMRTSDMVLVETPLLEEVRAQHRREDELMERKEVITEGEYTCNCKSEKVGKTLRQTRSADEPMTVFLRCCDCGNNWRE